MDKNKRNADTLNEIAKKSLKNDIEHMMKKNDDLMNLFKSSHGELYVIDSVTKEIILMNKNAENLIGSEKSNHKIFLDNIYKINSLNSNEVMKKIQSHDIKEIIEVSIGDKNVKGAAIFSSTKINFNNKPAFLIGLFDITEQKEAAENFRNIAIKDNLTGLFNRYYFDLRTQDEIAISDRYGEPLTMMMLDLDHFKNINDTWGHPAGDEVLKKTAEMLSSVIRKSDFVFRVGGEEFVVLMPKTEIENAMAVEEKIRKAIENTEYNIPENVTISIGVSQKQKSEMLDSWYSRTDKALYYAKESGRNCVVNFEEMNNNIFAFARIEWKNQWNCNNIEIDKQHKKIVELANTLLFMAFSNNKSEKILEQFNKVIEHVVYHFNFEEELLGQIGYDNCDEHAKIHRNLIEKTLKLKEAYIKDELKATAFFSYVVEDVVMGHMVKEDAKFFKFMKTCNKQQTV